MKIINPVINSACRCSRTYLRVCLPQNIPVLCHGNVVIIPRWNREQKLNVKNGRV